MASNSSHTDFANIRSFNNSKDIEHELRKKDEHPDPTPYADFYKMDHTQRGVAVIFNHVNFDDPQNTRRDGADIDGENLKRVLRELNFHVLSRNDLTFREITGVLNEVSRMDHRDSDCLVVVVMSHGENGTLLAKDREYPTKTLWQYFDARSCPTLAGKPKMFFIQACRGSELHPAAELHYKQIEEDSSSSYDAKYTIPVMADILIMYSTVEGFASCRSAENGSCFIQSLVRQLTEHYRTKDLLSILTFVNREVAIDFTYNHDNPELRGRKQMCSIVSMLTRFVYFTRPAGAAQGIAAPLPLCICPTP